MTYNYIFSGDVDDAILKSRGSPGMQILKWNVILTERLR